LTELQISGITVFLYVNQDSRTAAAMVTDAHWDLGKLITDLGGADRVRSLLLAQNMRVPSLRTLYYWQSEERSPANGIALVMALARRLDKEFDPLRYLNTSFVGTVANGE
jgi:hypothetical protein